MDYLEFGASLYLPATRTDLTNIGNGIKYPKLKSAIFCTEDSINIQDLDLAMDNISKALKTFKNKKEANVPYRFIRPRTPEVLSKILEMDNIETIQGFTLPKFSLDNMEKWFNILEKHPSFLCMPILETKEVFDEKAMINLRTALLNSPVLKQIAILRIGGLDLLNLFGIRRDVTRPIYDTVLSHSIKSIATIFIPYGFKLSAPAFESIEHQDTMLKEVELDKLHGFFHKSIIHPTQIETMEQAYKVKKIDLDVAKALTDPNTPAVFRLDGRMCEKTTHINWARRILYLADLYGIYDNY